MKIVNMEIEFWRRKPLRDMDPGEWEAVCDGCGLCCLHKLQDEETGEVVYTSVACRLLDIRHCRCRDYSNRNTARKECIHMTPANIETMSWLPSTCAYRLLLDGKDLPSWHPLVSGDPESVHTAGISLRNKAIPEKYVDEKDLEMFIIDMED